MGKKKQKKGVRSRPSSQSGPNAQRPKKILYSQIREVLLLSFCAILVFFIYSNTLGAPFIFDDARSIQLNQHIRLNKLTTEGIIRAGLKSPSSHRPVANISFALNYYFHQYNVGGYHVVNILIHIASGIFLYLFITTTLKLPALRSKYETYKWLPLLTTLIWMVHPLHTQSVTYIVQRMNSMAAMFYVLSLFLYVKARITAGRLKKWALFAGCVLAGILALGSKQNAGSLPFFIIIYEWYFFQDLSKEWLKRHPRHFLMILLLIGLIAFIYLGTNPWEKLASIRDFALKEFTFSERVLTQFRVVTHYISLLMFPHPSRLNLDYDFPLSHSLIDPLTTLFSIVAVAGLITLAIYIAKKERLLSFCILWFFGNLVIESSIIPLGIIFEHRTYLPSMLVSLMVVILGYRFIKPKWLGIGVTCSIVAVLSLWTYERNKAWKDDVSIWKDSVEKSPQKARPHMNLAIGLEGQAKYDEAMLHYWEALRLKPDYVDVRVNLGRALESQGKVTEAINQFSEALRLDPESAEAHLNWSAALARQEKFDEAIGHLIEALRINPNFAQAHNNLALALGRQGKIKEALDHYYEALQIDPDFAQAHNNLAMLLESQEKFEDAIRHYSEALRINPDFDLAHNNLGTLLERQGKVEEAIRHYYEALRINPDLAQAHNNLGVALEREGRFKEAISHHLKALQIDPDYAEAHNGLGVALQKQGKLEEAIKHYSEATRLNPDYAIAHYNLGSALIRKDRLDEAVKALYKAIQVKPDYAKAHFNLGVAFYKQGEEKEAAYHFSEVLRINPDDMRARRALELVTHSAPR